MKRKKKAGREAEPAAERPSEARWTDFALGGLSLLSSSLSLFPVRNSVDVTFLHIGRLSERKRENDAPRRSRRHLGSAPLLHSLRLSHFFDVTLLDFASVWLLHSIANSQWGERTNEMFDPA
jgi:hypothetical protein